MAQAVQECSVTELGCTTLREDFDEVCATFQTVLLNLGFEENEILVATFEACRISTAQDDFDRQERMLVEWIGKGGDRFANLVRYADGSLFAEHDVLRPHPQNPDLFVEAIEIWGRAGSLKGEARLLSAL